MSYLTAHTITLQDGSRCNVTKRLARGATPLVQFLATIPDPRAAQGRRHSLTLILLLCFVATLQGSQRLKDISLFGRLNQRLFERLFGDHCRHGSPSATTISRTLQLLEPELLVATFVQFLAVLGVSPATTGDVLSFDGKTIRAATGIDPTTGEAVTRHLLSLFSHDSHLAIGQVGVASKASEIAVLDQLLTQAATAHHDDLIAGKLLIGDALHTQKTTARRILDAGADYLFVVKGNQPSLELTIRRTVARAVAEQGAAIDSYTLSTRDRGRAITAVVTSLNLTAAEVAAGLDDEGRALLADWPGVVTIGVLRRTGTRRGKGGKVTEVDELIGVMSSRPLSAEAVATHLRRHWCIENNLHWVKDEVYGEDKHTLRCGKAPQVMSFIRSMCITVCNALRLKSISDVIHNLQKSTRLLEQFLRMAAIV